MAFLIGTDEAGYGPNLGPLTVTGTLWKVSSVQVDLYDQLAGIVSAVAIGRGKPIDSLHVADSKLVYKSSGSIESLERSVLALLFSQAGQIPEDEQELLKLVWSKCIEHRVALLASEAGLWRQPSGCLLPICANAGDIRRLGLAFGERCQRESVELCKVLCHPVFPHAFNRDVAQVGNKATLLSSVTLKIVCRLLEQVTEDVLIVCDKHGGRGQYLNLLQRHVTNQPVVTECESRAISNYRWRHNGHEVEIRFVSKGESFLPTAAASMVSKYVREVFMDIWNEFWVERLPDLKPTKGYPLDAKRFLAEIQSELKRLSIAETAIWRSR